MLPDWKLYDALYSLLFPGHSGPLGTNAVPLKYFRNVPSYSATRDFSSCAHALESRFFWPSGDTSFISMMAESRSDRIKRATSVWRSEEHTSELQSLMR